MQRLAAPILPTEPRIEVLSGCMFSGKTEELCRRLRRAYYARQGVIAIRPGIDNRLERTIEDDQFYQTLKVPSSTAEELLLIVKRLMDEQRIQVVGIDEAQFFDLKKPMELPKVCIEMVHMGLVVIAAGLNLDYEENDFGPIPNLMARASRPEMLTAICTRCGSELAVRSQRIIELDSQVVIGGQKEYEARCIPCFERPKK